VLARYVQMATAGGVTQAFYPEGGLSLNGRLQRPKMGLLSYLIEGFDPEGERDVVFVPVAINYDRVLEDRVLIAADKRGDRRFGARITVIIGFILRKLWQRLTRQETRFGTAAVAFGTPLSMREEGRGASIDALSEAIMARIARAMPVPIVPLVARALLEEGALTEEALLRSVEAMVARLPEGTRVVAADATAKETRRALRRLEGRGLVAAEAGQWRATDRDVLAFYANSVAHHLEKDDAPAARNAAVAGS
jgi:glycerol-3-phosphate O-acyltransferase